MRRKIFAVITVMILLMTWVMSACAEEKKFKIVVWHGDETEKRIAITVDDCYNMLLFDEMLDLCEEYQIPMTFFLVGSGVKAENAEHYLRALADGCELGNHTFSHAALTLHDSFYIHNQLRNTQKRLDEVLGFHYPMQVMRPPFGKYTKSNGGTIISAVTDMGYQHIVLWSVSQTDPKIAINQITNGSIALYHTNPQDVKCLRELIPELIERGFEFCTVSDLLGMDPVATSTDLPEENV